MLRQYLREVPVTRPYFEVTANSPDEQVAADARRHLVFRLDVPDDSEKRCGGTGAVLIIGVSSATATSTPPPAASPILRRAGWDLRQVDGDGHRAQ